jgi:hypothetical protein
MADENEKAEVAAESTESAEAKMYAYLLKTFGPTAPSADKVNEWKATYGRVRFLPLSDTEVYFIRPVKRSEYKVMVAAAQAAGGEDPDTFLRESLVAKCVLWPQLDTAQFSAGFAGTIDSLWTIIMDASNFLSQEALFTVVREL